eukprot:CAMPEP_0198223956 /NCGR_PEP_ID=MMETSP1445-20131203/94774_1 /TAXON_ID=36898 /ORGANISM="Pyramimonas sp., Strain CCMP2087" /LENGTH=55 /DNA_ID=CAMNT_0043902961 /DNA_START=79 /DNA_END=242 /DNA_ORIENTATION=-
MGLNEDQKPTNKTKATWASDSSDEGGAERWKDKVVEKELAKAAVEKEQGEAEPDR